MERFCNRCGSLVNGDGVFCPNCGEKLESAVDLGKPASQDMMPGASASSNTFGSTNTNDTSNSANTVSSTGGFQGQMPSYSQPIQQPYMQSEMTVGEWVLTIFLSSLSVIGLILLLVWAFSNDTPISKRNYARAMLIWYGISIGLSIILTIGLFVCTGFALGGIGELFDNSMPNANSMMQSAISLFR